jgi:hypothetical protein
MRRLVGTGLALVLVLAGTGGQGDRPAVRDRPAATAGRRAPATTRPSCTPRSVRAAVAGFFAAMADGRVRDLDAFVAPAPQFKWYSNGVPPGVRSGDRATDRRGLLAYLRQRQASHERVEITWLRVAGGGVQHGLGHFGMRLRRTADDLPGGPQPLAGKGAVDCDDRHRLVVVSIGLP